MSAYFIANIKIYDEDEYNKYLEKVDEVFAKFNGEYLVIDKNPTVLEGEWNYSRAVIIKFPTQQDHPACKDNVQP